jgi:thiamine-phosphate pyrophosphorylase
MSGANEIRPNCRLLDFRLYFVTDRKQTAARSLVDVVHAALGGGVRAVQLREKDLGGGELYRLAARVRKITERYRARLLINDRLDVALAVGADGVHLGQTSFPVAATRRLLGPGKLIGVSTHSLAEITAAAGADFVVFGPVYFTPSKAAYGEPQGVDRLREATVQSSVPVFAIGGINADRISDVLTAGAYGVAMISAISAASDPTRAAQELLCRLPNHTT